MDDILNIIKDNPDIKNESKQAIIEFRKENLCNRAKQGEKLVALFPGIKTAINMLRDEVFEVGSENELLKQELGEENIERVNENIKKLITENKNNDTLKNAYVYNRMKRRQQLIKQLTHNNNN